MITHGDLWDTIDTLAIKQQITPSRMAQNCGLDATTFNKSKRCDTFGKSRYPSFRTVIKVLNQMGISMSDFGKICDEFSNKRQEQA